MLNLLCVPLFDDEVEVIKILDVGNDGYISLNGKILEIEMTDVIKKVLEVDENNDGKIFVYDLQKMLRRPMFGYNLSFDDCMKMISPCE